MLSDSLDESAFFFHLLNSQQSVHFWLNCGHDELAETELPVFIFVFPGVFQEVKNVYGCSKIFSEYFSVVFLNTYLYLTHQGSLKHLFLNWDVMVKNDPLLPLTEK